MSNKIVIHDFFFVSHKFFTITLIKSEHSTIYQGIGPEQKRGILLQSWDTTPSLIPLSAENKSKKDQQRIKK
jgi:hypothetical protein